MADILTGALPDDRLPVVSPDGQLGSVPTAKYSAAIASGYRHQTADEQEKYASQLKFGERPLSAAAAGAGRGATLGLSDAALTATGLVRPETLKGLQEENPGASTAGDLAGTALSLLAAPEASGPGLVAKVGRLAEGVPAATRLGRLGAKALAGAAEGSLFGAGNAVSDAALGDQQLNAEKLISHMGLGAVLGGGAGALAGGVGEAARAILPRAQTVAGNAQGVLDELANDSAVKSTRAAQTQIAELGETKAREVGEMLRTRGHLGNGLTDLRSPADMVKSLTKDVSETGALKGSFLDKADAQPLKPDFGAAMTALDDFEAGLSPLKRDAIAGDLKAARTSLEDVATDPKKPAWRAFDDWKQDLQAKAKWKGPSPVDTLSGDLKRQIAGVAREELDRQLVPVLGAEGQSFLDAKKLYGNLKTASKLAATGAKRSDGLGLKDLLYGIAGGGIHPLGMVAALGSKFMREHGDALISKFADRLATSPALSAAAQSFATKLPQLAPAMGQSGQLLLTKAAMSPAHALATHLLASQVDPEYVSAARGVGLQPETPNEHAAAVARSTNLASLAATLQQHDKDIDAHIDAIFSGKAAPSPSHDAHDSQDFGAKRMRRDTLESHRQMVKEAAALAADPASVAERVAKNMGHLEAPGIAGALTDRALVAAQYLAQAGAGPPKKGPLAPEWHPPQAEIWKYAQKVEAVREPLSVLRNAANGTLTRDQVDALKAVHPTLLRDISDRMLLKLAESPEDVPYRARLMLSMLTGMDVDGTMSPKAIAANQNAIANAQGKPSEKMGPSGAKELTVASMSASPSERRELQRTGES